MKNGELFPGLASKAAKAMSALGSSKGGKARANTLTPEERSEIARNAVRARWKKQGKLKDEQPKQESGPDKENGDAEPKESDAFPFSMFRGKLQIGNMEMECHVLNDLRRVFTQREIVRVLTAGRDSGNLTPYLESNPLINNAKSLGETISFRVPGTQYVAIGREATVLIEICEKYLQALDQKKLRPNQLKLAIQAGIIIRACAKVGIIALIDEATGFQQYRAKRDLQLKLQAFIADDIQEWARMFKDEFWFELARLEGIHYSPRNRPLRWGKYVMFFVYDAIDRDVGNELRKKNPNPHFLKNHHQWLKKFGRDKVHDQIERTITVMKLCKNMNDFREKFARVFNKSPQTSFDEINWSADVKLAKAS